MLLPRRDPGGTQGWGQKATQAHRPGPAGWCAQQVHCLSLPGLWNLGHTTEDPSTERNPSTQWSRAALTNVSPMMHAPYLNTLNGSHGPSERTQVPTAALCHLAQNPSNVSMCYFHKTAVLDGTRLFEDLHTCHPLCWQQPLLGHPAHHLLHASGRTSYFHSSYTSSLLFSPLAPCSLHPHL